jgi:hypothetical protein
MNINPHFQISSPLINCLTEEAFQFVRVAAGFPDGWTKFKVSTWLGSVFDRVTFISVTNLDNVVHQINTQYPNIFDEIDFVEVCIPVNAFVDGYMEYIHRELANIEFNTHSGWLQYINRGGTDRFNIRVRLFNLNINRIH